MSSSIVKIDENERDIEEENWWELWDRRRGTAVAQVLCYAVHAICMLRVYYHVQCTEPEMSRKERKRKARTWEKQLKSVKEAIKDVSEAIKEGNAIIEKARKRIYTEREIYAELVKIGVEKNVRFAAYTFLTKDPTKVRAFFGYPVDERKEFLIQMMYGPEDP
ncbi:hypothetical protein JCGZ_02118 [Jatropha curcas]|uniref:Uncharacterized protein n=1 Tax=Jatropha curcas TaxID=180498 RepID=A0A067L6J7_JATCU|nr:hypothetical protein JCGZ_02118 [Jatropha curcas]